MSCERFETQIPDYVEGSLNPSRELEQHLETCSSCREKETDMRRTLLMMHQWSDESVPAWNRAPVGFFNPKRPNWIWSWGPLLVAVVLFGFVMLHLEVKVHDQGTTIRFSKTDDSTEMIDQLVAQMDARDQQYRASLQSMLETYQSEQEQLVERIVENAMVDQNQDLKKSIRVLNETWKNQREKDTQYFQRQIHAVQRYTNQNYDNLNVLANHVANNDRRSP